MSHSTHSSELNKASSHCCGCANTAATVSADLQRDLLAPFTHVCSLSAKGIRSRLVDAFNTWLLLPAPLAEGVKLVVDMLHNASLLMDDIEDGSELRRGAPAAHLLFGTPLTMNCANQVYFVALQRVLALPALALAAPDLPAEQQQYYQQNISALTAALAGVFADEMVELHEGQGMDILWRDAFRCPSHAEYDVMVLKKTGGLFRLALRLMLALAPPSPALTDDRREALVRLVERIGVFFQTLDDYLNVSCEQYHQNKTFFEDLTEGKFSYPIIHHVHAAGPVGDQRLLHILKQRPTDMNVKRFAVQLLRETGSLDATRARVDALRAEVNGLLSVVGGSPQIDACIQKMCTLMPDRA